MKSRYKMGDPVIYGEAYNPAGYRTFGKYNEQEGVMNRFVPSCTMKETENLCILSTVFDSGAGEKNELLDDCRDAMKALIDDRCWKYGVSVEELRTLKAAVDHIDYFCRMDECFDDWMRSNPEDNFGVIIGKYRQRNERGREKGKVWYEIHLRDAVPYGHYYKPSFLNGRILDDVLKKSGHDGLEALSSGAVSLMKSLEGFNGDARRWTRKRTHRVLATTSMIAMFGEGKKSLKDVDINSSEDLHRIWNEATA